MLQNWYLIFAIALTQSFILSLVFTWGVRKLALRWDIVDEPGERKMHTTPIPLLGGVAIYAAFVSVLVMGAAVLSLDFGKATVLKAQMQNAADAAVMSAAMQLDGQGGAQNRAIAVIEEMGAPLLGAIVNRFHSDLPFGLGGKGWG